MHDQIIRNGLRFWVTEKGIIKWEVHDHEAALAHFVDIHEDDIFDMVDDLKREGYFAQARREQ